MRTSHLLAIALLAVPAFAEPPGPQVDFDRGAGTQEFLGLAARALPPAKLTTEEQEPVWISLSPEDLGDLRWTSAAIPLGAAISSNGQASVFKVSADELPRISELMHERFGRCGGFFAHSSREEAEQDLRPLSLRRSGPYSVDQGAFLAPALDRIRESELRGTIEALSAHHNRYYTADGGVAAARWLLERWQGLAAGLPRTTAILLKHPGWAQPSVVLTIPGSERPGEIVVVGGHLDSISGYFGKRSRAPGADDNASGIAVLTEAIRVLAASGFRPRRTVQFMAYAAEEVGLRGSKEIASRYRAEGLDVAGVVQFDMTNFAGSGEGVFLITDHVDPELTAFLRRLAETYAGVNVGTLACGYGCSDNASWTRSGFPASAAFESAFSAKNRKIHSADDTLANSGGTARHSVPFAKLAAAFAAELAKQGPARGAPKTGR